jgi:hypothetical protein
MVDEKVAPEVIKTYIQNSPTAYHLSAAEIIALRDHGLGADILTAMLQHGAEMRAQAMRAAPAATGPSALQATPGTANPYAPAYDYGGQPVYPAYTYPYSDSSYLYPYSDGYPVYGYGAYNCGYYWPWCWPSLYFGCYPYGGYWGYPYCSFGYGYPYGYGRYGYGYYHGGRGYYSGRGYYGGGARPVPYAGHNPGSRSFGSAARPAAFAGRSGGFRAGGGFSVHAASFAGRGGGGGHSMGRGR